MSSVATESGVGKSTLFDIKNSMEKTVKSAGEAQLSEKLVYSKES